MANEQTQDTAILIPSYKPDHKLAPYVQELRDAGFAKIVVVDDGSGDAFAEIFAGIPQDDIVHIIQYTPNAGKGEALKRGMCYLRDECPQCEYIITADSDGQHIAPDVLRVCDRLHEMDGGLLLGSRDFSKAGVPARSIMGNRITAVVFLALYGTWVEDTQTGLRGFPRNLLDEMIAVKGARYEYEMNMLIAAATKKIPIRKISIETVYENNNEGSHFRTVQDSARIYGIIFAGFFRFMSVSLVSALIDWGLYKLINNLIITHAPQLVHQFRFLFLSVLLNILLATILARILSSIFNFFVNKNFVFADHGDIRKSLPRYLCTFLIIMLLSGGLTSSFHVWFGMGDGVAKIIVDICLFFLSYQIQQRWVFAKGTGTK